MARPGSTAPTKVTASATNTSIVVSWEAATDNKAVTRYQVTRTGGSKGTVVTDVGSTVYSDTGLEEKTAYTYIVKAVDAAGNTSPGSAEATATTGSAAPAPATGTPLGTDPRKDPIYFVLTARFYDGDSTNNRGGSQHTKSGNAANNDPMFRGDFKGLVEKLDYIKALGFSAVWITPVVLNRSDYDYHGYHGYDFYKVDPRLESAGATYQDLINAAHAKGMKIYQDVVYNHSSRWGAKGLYTPTVYGVRDSEWSWYYDERNEGFEYDGLTVETKSGKSYYNGDLWSTAEPTGNTCVNWGKPTGGKSAEGYALYNCQWPSPTSGMFPKAYYHQCWIGNWEGEDSRSCWLHEDLADFDTESTPVQNYLTNAFLIGNSYHTPDRSQFSGMNIIDMRMHMNFRDAQNAYGNGKDSDDSVNDATYNVVYVDSHDYGPNKSSTRYTGGTDAWAENMALMWTFRGIPTLYYGSEIEFQKGRQIDCGPTCPLASTGRAYYGDHLQGAVTASEFGTADSATGEVATTLAQPLVKHLQRLNQIRRAIPALQMGQYSTDGISGQMAFKRRYTAGGTDSLALVTVTGDATYTGIPNGTYRDAVTGETQTVTGGTLSVSAPGKGNLRVYVLDGPGKIGVAGPYLK